jgi:hypothetical protein
MSGASPGCPCSIITKITGERFRDSMLRQNVLSMRFILAAVIFLSCAALVSPVRGMTKEHGFSVKEYEEFHHVLHPLEHEALPANDFKRIREKAAELVTRGEAVVKLGVPGGVAEKSVGEFKEWLGKFAEALKRFKADAGSATDDELKASYSAVHDSFEMLAALLPRK